MRGTSSETCCSTTCTTRVLLCRCTSDKDINQTEIENLIGGLEELDVDLVVVDDLCDLAAHNSVPLVDRLGGEGLSIVACENRAVRWLLNYAGCEKTADTVKALNVRHTDPEHILRNITTESCCRESADPVTITHDGDWLPWFPVIDFERCTHCQQCASFCLFDVFSVSKDGMVEVAQPANCKPNCPACARVCPEGAIMFPKSRETQINGGEWKPGALADVMPGDLLSALGDDPLAALALRREQAKSRLLRPEALARAEAERERCACSCEKAPFDGMSLPMVGAADTPCCAKPSTPQGDST